MLLAWLGFRDIQFTAQLFNLNVVLTIPGLSKKKTKNARCQLRRLIRLQRVYIQYISNLQAAAQQVL